MRSQTPASYRDVGTSWGPGEVGQRFFRRVV